MAADKSQSLWTPAFALLCCAPFFGSAQHALLQPTFPLYITSLGGRPLEVGLPLSNGVGALICGGVIQSVELFLEVSCDRRHRRRSAGYDRQPRVFEIEDRVLIALCLQKDQGAMRMHRLRHLPFDRGT